MRAIIKGADPLLGS